MAKRFSNPVLSDRERIFMHVIQGLAWSQGRRGSDAWSSEPYKKRDGGWDVHFAKWDKAAPGDLCLACTGYISEWKIAWMVRFEEYGTSLVRAVGSTALCNYGNESWYPIRGLWPDQILEGERYQFHRKVTKAIWKGDKDCYRYGGMEFISQRPAEEQAMESGGMAKIWIRQKFGHDTKPFSVEMEWGRKTSVKSILARLVEGGYGTHVFELKEE